MLYETVDALMDGICDAVREKEGSTDLVDHQDIPSRVKAIKTAYGGTAEEKDMAEDKSAFVNGEEVFGKLPVYENLFEFTDDLVSIGKLGQQIALNVNIDKDCIFRSGCNIKFRIKNSRFGDADLSDVVAGKTFTSSAGFQKEGEHVCSSVVVEPELEVDNLSELHYWEKVAEGNDLIEEMVTDYCLVKSSTSASFTYYGFTHYASEITTADGALALVDPVARGTIDKETLAGKYIQNGSDFYRVPDDVIIDKTSLSTGVEAVANRVFKLTYIASGKVSYVVSSDPDAFPQNGMKDGYSYVYKGTLNETGTEAVIAALTITENGTYTVPAGVDGYSPITVNVTTEDIPAVSQAVPVIEVSASGLITATATQDGGQVVAGTKSATKQLSTQAAKTYTPGTADQVISSGKYLTGAQTIKGDANLLAENIPEGVTLFGIAGKRSMSSADLSDIGKLHFWEKYIADPYESYGEAEVTNVALLVYSKVGVSTSTRSIYYGKTFTFDEETKQFNLDSDGYCSTLATAQTVLPGKYIRYESDYNYLYYVPEDAVLSESQSTLVGTAKYIHISKATKITANELLGYVASEGSETYPENGEHSDGYWYVYRGLLADALGQ